MIHDIGFKIPLGVAIYYHQGGGNSLVDGIAINYEDQEINRNNQRSNYTVTFSHGPSGYETYADFKKRLIQDRPHMTWHWTSSNRDIKKWGGGIVFEDRAWVHRLLVALDQLEEGAGVAGVDGVEGLGYPTEQHILRRKNNLNSAKGQLQHMEKLASDGASCRALHHDYALIARMAGIDWAESTSAGLRGRDADRATRVLMKAEEVLTKNCSVSRRQLDPKTARTKYPEKVAARTIGPSDWVLGGAPTPKLGSDWLAESVIKSMLSRINGEIARLMRLAGRDRHNPGDAKEVLDEAARLRKAWMDRDLETLYRLRGGLWLPTRSELEVLGMAWRKKGL